MVNYYTWHHGTLLLFSQSKNPISSKKRKYIIEEEFKVEHWSRLIVLASNQTLSTTLSPFIIEQTIKKCASEVKNATKLRSDSLIIECFRKQTIIKFTSIQAYK
jgi:hypothetical protein